MNKSSRNFLIAILCTLGQFYVFTGKMAIMPMLPAIERSFSLSHAKATTLWTGFVIVYALVQLFVYKFIKILGKKRTIVLGTGLYGLTIFWVLFVRSYESFMALQIISAIPNGVIFLTGLAVVDELRDDKRSGFLFGFYVAISGIGYITSSLLATLAIDLGNWRLAYAIWAPLGIVIALLIQSFLPEDEKKPELAQAAHISVGDTFRHIVSFPYLIILVGYFMNAARMFTYNAFICPYFVDIRGITQQGSALIYTGIMLAGFAAQLTGGMITDRVGPTLTLILALSGAALFMNIFHAFSNVALAICFAMLLQFASNLCYPILLRILMRLVPEHARTSTLGAAQALNFVASGIGPPLIGRVIDRSGFAPGFFGVSLFGLTTLAFFVVAAIFWPQVRNKKAVPGAVAGEVG